MNRSIARLLTLLTLVVALGLALPASGVLGAKATKQPTATGMGGAVATVDLDASQVGMQVLKDGGNATDAAVATAAALGVTEPYSCGIGGGGFMVVYDAKSERVSTIDSRETAPAAFEPDSFIDPATGEPIPFAERVTSGLGVGVPGTIRGWEQALGEVRLQPLSELLQPSIRLANGGFTVDSTYRQQTLDNLDRFKDFTSTRETFLRDGQAPAVGSTVPQPRPCGHLQPHRQRWRRRLLLRQDRRGHRRRGTEPAGRGQHAQRAARPYEDDGSLRLPLHRA